MLKNPESIILEAIDFECPICLQIYDQVTRVPMMICPFQHTCCLACLDNKLFKSKQPREEIDCYYCKSKITKIHARPFRLLKEIRQTARSLRASGKNIQKKMEQLGDQNQNLLNQLKNERYKNQWLIQQSQQKQQALKDKYERQIQQIKAQSDHQAESKIRKLEDTRKYEQLQQELKIQKLEGALKIQQLQGTVKIQKLEETVKLREKQEEVKKLELSLKKLPKEATSKNKQSSQITKEQKCKKDETPKLKSTHLPSDEEDDQQLRRAIQQSIKTEAEEQIKRNSKTSKNKVQEKFQQKEDKNKNAKLITRKQPNFMQIRRQTISEIIEDLKKIPQAEKQNILALTLKQTAYFNTRLAQLGHIHLDLAHLNLENHQLLNALNFDTVNLLAAGDVNLTALTHAYYLHHFTFIKQLANCLLQFKNLRSFAFYFRFPLIDHESFRMLNKVLNNLNIDQIKIFIDPAYEEYMEKNNWAEAWIKADDFKRVAKHEKWDWN